MRRTGIARGNPNTRITGGRFVLSAMLATLSCCVSANDSPSAPEFDSRVVTHGPPLEPLLDSSASPWPRIREWGGLRPWLVDRGVVVNTSWITDGSLALAGGAAPGRSVLRSLFHADLSVDLAAVAGGRGTVFVEFLHFTGPNGSLEFGDFQGFSNIDADSRTQLAQAWYEIALADDALRLRLGKMDANVDFAYSAYGSSFLQSSMGVSPTIFPIPTYPDPSAGVAAFLDPGDGWSLGLGLFDGAGVRGIPTGSRPPRIDFATGRDLFGITEGALHWVDVARPGRLAVGTWYHNGEFDRFDGTTRDGVAGFYAIVDQQLLLREHDDDPALGAFLMYGFAPRDVAEARSHLAAGLEWTGPLRRRPDDVLSLGVSTVWFSTAAGAGFGTRTETAIELLYGVQLLPCLNVTFDLQHVIDPGGVAERPDLWVGTIRTVLQF